MQTRFIPACSAVFAWEMRMSFRRPATYVLLLAASLLAAWSFSWLVMLLARGSDLALQPGGDAIAQFLGPNVFLVGGCMVLIPLLTMNAIADERRRASWELLVTTPVSPLSIVVGKFAALWCLFMTCLVPWGCSLIVLRVWNGKLRFVASIIPWIDGPGLTFDPGPAVGGGIALAIVGATFVAVGLFCSGLCQRPASAALVTAAAMGIIFLLGIVPRVLANWGCSTDQIRLAEIVSFWGHVDRLSRGVIEPRVIAGHLTMCAGFVWGTSRIARRMDEAGEPGA